MNKSRFPTRPVIIGILVMPVFFSCAVEQRELSVSATDVIPGDGWSARESAVRASSTTALFKTPKGTLSRLPRGSYVEVFHGAYSLDVSDPVSQACAHVWSFLRPMLGNQVDFTWSTPTECKVFRFPRIIRISSDMEMAGVPCRAGLVGFHSNGQLGMCILSDKLFGEFLLPGDLIGFDESGYFNYPSESKYVNYTIEARPSGCNDVVVKELATQYNTSIGPTPTSVRYHVQALELSCTCAGGQQKAQHPLCVNDCTLTFHCP